MMPIRIRKGGRFKRFLRGVGWTLLGILAVLILLVILGMTIPPQRGAKTRSLENEDFGLGFKIGDPWNPDAFEASMKTNGIRVTRDDSFTNSSLTSTIWSGNRSFLTVQVCAPPKGNAILVNDIMLSVYVPFVLNQQKTLLENYGIAARAAGWFYPEIKTDNGITMGVDEETVRKAYGKPLIRMTTNEEGNGPYLIYVSDRQFVSFCFSDGCLSHMDALAPTNSKYLNRLFGWLGFVISPVIEVLNNQQLKKMPTPVNPDFRPETNGTATDGK